MLEYIKRKDAILILTKYEFKLRYRGSVLGLSWSILAPLLLALVLYFVFKNVFTFVENFALYVLVGVFVFRFFQVGTSVGMFSVLGKSYYVTKTNLPREILPFTTTVTYAISSFIELLILIPILYFSGGKICYIILLLPLIHLIYFFFVYGSNLILSALMVYFRDLNQVWEVIVNILFFASPIVYPVSVIPEKYRTLYMLNPITRIIELYRNVMLYGRVSITDFSYVLLSSVLILVLGHVVFCKLQKKFGEVL